jgi:hypothetical protein
MRITSLMVATVFSTYVVAQTAKAPVAELDSCTNSKSADSLAKQKDMGDVLRSLLKMKPQTGPDCTLEKPGKLFFSLVPAVGYTLEGGPIAVLSMNASFYSSDPKITNLSVFTFGGQYSLHNQLMIPIISNIWSKDNKYDWLGDWRFYRYPAYTYGLGSDNSYSREDAIVYSYIKVYQEVLRHFSSNFYGGIGYNFDDHFNITDNGDATNYQQYNDTYNNSAAKTISSGPIVHFMYDSRSNSNNPKDAFYASIILRDNLTFLGSTQNWQYVQVEVRKYIKLSPHDVLAFWSWNEFTNGPAPYFDLPADQWDTYGNTGRGYIQNFYRGTNFVYLEAEYRFRILNNGLLGGVVFSNAGSATQWPSNKFEYVDPGNGIGLRFKFNKYSDVNFCVDYAVGLYGSKGFFFNLGEVF